MKRLILLLCLVSLGGCIMPVIHETEVLLIGSEGVIHAPKINGLPLGYDANVQPGDLIRLDFRPGIDQYGNPTGFSASKYELTEVTVKCDLKAAGDTIFRDYAERNTENIRIWFPGWTAPIELISGLPIPLLPLTGYPWDSCMAIHSMDAWRERESLISSLSDSAQANLARYVDTWIATTGIGLTCQPKSLMQGTPSQMATITAVGRAEWIEVAFVLPEQDGTYTLDLPGQSPTSKNRITIRIAEHGLYQVIHSDGDVFEFVVPIDWFFVEGTWRIDVGPGGLC